MSNVILCKHCDHSHGRGPGCGSNEGMLEASISGKPFESCQCTDWEPGREISNYPKVSHER